MQNNDVYTIQTKRKNLLLRAKRGHFATSHSHINYFFDVTMQKSRLSEAKAIAEELLSYYQTTTIIDTILCLDGMQVVGTCLAEALTNNNFMNLNAHQTIYVVTPEYTAGSQIIFRDNLAAAIAGKNVLILAASVVTGYTSKSAIEAITYYGGRVAGISSIFATVDSFMGYDVVSAFDPNDIPGYNSYAPHECPMCKQGDKLEGLVNSFGFSKL
ncbi:MAG: orotate phosphoribosyltransferase [Clostridia bacterium]|nr:orotate phosphoribosyltransferase [Clostridia bacterium]